MSAGRYPSPHTRLRWESWENRHQLYRSLEEVLGHDEATVMLLGMGAILTFPLTVQQIVAAAIS